MEDQEVRREIGKRLKEARKAAKLSQEEVAASLKVKRQAVSSWESGETMPEAQKWYRLGIVYGVSLDWLVYGIRTKPITRAPILEKILTADAVESRFGEETLS